MNSIKLSSLILFLAIVAVSVFIGGRQINAKIEETIKNNYQTEIDSLKEKLNKQSELLNSIINLNDKKDDSENTSTPDNEKDESENVTTEEKSEFEYIIENGGVTITKYNGKQTSVQIPNKIEQLPVLKIGENAFADLKVKSVTLPSSCTEIDWFAFYGCYALTTVYVSENVSEIGYGAFDGCSKSLTIYCVKNSFAEKYAQSFGISYSNFQ